VGIYLLVTLVALGVIAVFVIMRHKQPSSTMVSEPPHGIPGQPLKLTSRYADADDVAFDLNKIPEDLRDLLPYAKEWAIGDDLERQAYAKSVSFEHKKAFVDAVMTKGDMLDSFHNAYKDANPIPDEVVVFDMMFEAAAELYPEVHPGGEVK
jgi:hypothetical protein